MLTALLLCFCFASCGGDGSIDYDPKKTGEGESVDMEKVKAEINSMKVSDFEETEEESDYVIIKVKNYGDIVVVLREDIAPISVKNFKKLVSEKFYDGLIFHRVMEGFMIQGGGITEQYTQKETETIKGEFALNGVTNNLLHEKGVLSMARTEVYDSATSQFFVMHAYSDWLDGSYAAFGYVLAGLDVVDAIAACQVTGSSNSPIPVTPVVIESARFAALVK